MGAGAGIMASLILTQILCDLTDNRYGRAAVFSLIAVVFSLFGIMHGMNPVDTKDRVPSSFPFFGSGDMKVKGQLTFSRKDSHPGWTSASFSDALCTQPPEFRVDQIQASGVPADGLNEGWRFAVGYGIVFVVCVVHMGMQKIGWLPPAIMDNGVKDAAAEAKSSTKSATEFPSLASA